MRSSPNPSAARSNGIDAVPDPPIHADPRPRSSILLPPQPGPTSARSSDNPTLLPAEVNTPARAKRKARSAFIEAIADLMGMPLPASGDQVRPGSGAS